MQSDGVNRRSGCVRIEGSFNIISIIILCCSLSYCSPVSDESLDLDSLLIKLCGRVDSKWYPLGMAIGIPTEFLDNLKGYPDHECMVEMLDYWFRHHPDQPTWKEIADAIEDIHDYLLAKSIKGVYDLPSKHIIKLSCMSYEL